MGSIKEISQPLPAVEKANAGFKPLRFAFYVLRSPLFLSLLLFSLALLPRLPDLGRFLTADEFLWVDRSRNFLAGLTNPAYECTTPVETWTSARGLACTLRTGHPGVTTMWTGSLGLLLRWQNDGRPGSLHDYVVAVTTNPLDPTFIAPERLGTVLLTSLWVVAVYWLARRLLGGRVALAAALLMALDPFHIALSRVIHHDALSTIFMTLAGLCALIYWTEAYQAGNSSPRYNRRWLIASGLLAGFGFLSKSPALFLMPFMALAGLWFWGQGRRQNPAGTRAALVRLVWDGLLWFVAAVAVFTLFWPAMWVVPLETLQTVIFVGSKYATGGHAKGNFFLGQISQDPGPLFYPVTWLYRASPLAVLGLLAALPGWLLWRRETRPADTGRRPAGDDKETAPLHPETPTGAFYRSLPLLLLFILVYTVLITTGEKKQDRYFLPVYPWFNLIAAGGLVTLTAWLTTFYRSRNPSQPPQPLRNTFYVLLSFILVLNGFLVATHFPYYFTYYNPLLGGLRGAAGAMTIGWGEGLDLAAAYLNEHDPGARVASWYESTFAPFYHGPSISYSKEKGKALAGDYAIFYINQTQRRYPDDALFDYFDRHFKPEKVITLRGLDYAWIYPSLGVDHYIQDQTYTGIASLLAWQWRTGPLRAGQAADFELYWEYLGKHADEPFFFRLVDAQGRTWAEAQSQLVDGENPPQETWREGEILVERGRLDLPADLPPGQYALQIGFYTRAPAVTSGELLFPLPDGEAGVTIEPAGPIPAFTLPPEAVPVDQPLGPALTLLGVTWPAGEVHRTAAESGPGSFPLDLYWRIEQPLPAETTVHVALTGAPGQTPQAWFDLSLAETFHPAATRWPAGTILRTRWLLELLPEVPPGDYHLELILPADTGQSLAVGRLTIRP